MLIAAEKLAAMVSLLPSLFRFVVVGLLLFASENEAVRVVNKAKFCLMNQANFSTAVNVTYDNCHDCRSRDLVSAAAADGVNSNFNCTHVLTDFHFRLFIFISNTSTLLNGTCDSTSLPHSAEERSTLNITVLSFNACVAKSAGGVWPYTPLLVTIAILVALSVSCAIFQLSLYARVRETLAWRFLFGTERLPLFSGAQSEEKRQQSYTSGTTSWQSPISDPKPHGAVALDTFRGFTLALWIFVNYGGGGYWFFRPSTWNGLTLGDIAFPWFVFVFGTSTASSLYYLDRRVFSRRHMFLLVVKRFVILFTLGLILNKSGDLSSYRVMGVLQRLAICYLVISLLHIILSPRGRSDPYDRDRFTPFTDITAHIMEWITIIIIAVVHTMITFLVHKESCPRGYLSAGGLLGDHGAHVNCTGGAAGFIDHKILGHAHMYQNPTCKDTYLTGPFDPEGFLSSLTAIVTAFLGMHAGRILSTYPDSFSHIVRWLINALVWGSIAIILCEGKKNGGIIPINKNLWSMSYCLAMSASAFFVLSVFYYITQVKRLWNGYPFTYLGRNAILIYVGHVVVAGWFPFDWSSKHSHTNIMARNMTGTTIWIIIAYYLNRAQKFIKI